MKMLEVKNAGPVRDFTIPLDKPGVYEILGPNGAGKSNMLLAIARALGNDVPAVLRDGARELSVTLDNQVLLSLTKVTKAGDVEGALMSSSPIANLILPNVKDADAAEERRIQALLKLVDLPVTDEAIITLVDGDAGVFDYVMEQEGETIRDLNIVEAKERVRRRVHEMKRGAESIAIRAQADIDANTVEKPTVLSKVSYEQAKADYRTSVSTQERLRGEASQRAAREQEREEIRETLGERPNIGLLARQHSACIEIVAEAHRQVKALEEQLADARTAFKLRTLNLEHAAQDLEDAERAAFSWDRRKAILDSDITGATEQDVEVAVADAERASREVERARQTETYTKGCQLVREAQERREGALEAAARYEKLATGVTGRLGLLLAEAGLDNLTVDEDRLCVVNADGTTEAFYRLSFGERATIACKLLINQKANHNIIALPWQFFASLSPENRTEVEGVFSKHGLFVLTERPAAGELRVEHSGNGDAAPKVEDEKPKRKRRAALK